MLTALFVKKGKIMSRKTKRIITYIGVILIAVAVCSFVGKISGGFQKDFDEWQLKERNEANLLSGTSFEEYNNGDGITLKAKKDGTVVIDGTYLGKSENIIVPIESVNLGVGTYTLSGAPKGGNYTYYIRAEYKDGSSSSVYAIGDFSNTATFTLTSAQSVNISIVIFPGVEFNNVNVRPVLVVGNEAGEFYA